MVRERPGVFSDSKIEAHFSRLLGVFLGLIDCVWFWEVLGTGVSKLAIGSVGLLRSSFLGVLDFWEPALFNFLYFKISSLVYKIVLGAINEL